MNYVKTGGSLRLLAFSLVAVIVALSVTVAVSGWSPEETDKPGDHATDETIPPESETEEEPVTDPAINLKPKYYYYLTGLECEEGEIADIPYAFVTDPSLTSYGISLASMVIEIPIENGNTRFLIFNQNIDSLGKIGAFAPTRDYITDVAILFGANLVSTGNDDLFDYTSIQNAGVIDLSEYEDYYYKEGAKYVFSNKNMISELSKKLKLPLTDDSRDYAFNFANPGEMIGGITKANTISLAYQSSVTTLKYNAATKSYALYKSSVEKIDPLNATTASFDNVFILFADSTTYERSSGIQTVIETSTSGSGYYCTGGDAKEIRWHASDGNITFEDLDGNPLICNRGTTYMGYFKSSAMDGVRFE